MEVGAKGAFRCALECEAQGDLCQMWMLPEETCLMGVPLAADGVGVTSYVVIDHLVSY